MTTDASTGQATLPRRSRLPTRLATRLAPLAAAAAMLLAPPPADAVVTDASAIDASAPEASAPEAEPQEDAPAIDVAPAHESFAALDLELDAAKQPERRLDKLLAPVAKRYDVVVLDCPPGMSLLSESILVAADVVAVPLVPSPLAMRALDQVVALRSRLRKRKPAVVAFWSMVDRRKTVHRELVQAAPPPSQHIRPVVVPYSTFVERMGTERAPIATFAPRSVPAVAFDELWAAVREAW